MKKILIALIALIPFISFGQSDDTTQYTYYRNVYGNRTDRLWGNKVLRAPLDTIYSKSGLAILNGTLYVGNGTQWSQVTGGGGSTDTTSLSNRINTKKDKSDSTGPSGYATIAGKAKSFDSLMIVLNNLYKSATDSVRSGGYSSNGHLNKALDSIKLVFNVLYKLTGDSVVLQGYSTNGHLNKSLDSLRLVFNTLLGGKVDTGTKANIYIYNQGTGVPLLSAHDSFLVAKRLFDTARVTWKQRIVGTDTSAYALFDTTGLSGVSELQ
jgi:hypothetical protein